MQFRIATFAGYAQGVGSLLPPPSLTLIERNSFGLLIAYVIPGFITLWGAGFASPMVAAWLQTAPSIPANLEAVFFVSLASVAAGMTVSAVRFVCIDQFHQWTGLPRPVWDDANLQRNLQAFDALVEDHYRYCQFHANTAVALGLAYASWKFYVSPSGSWSIDLGFLVIEVVLLVASRDNLQKYYGRAARLLGALSPSVERRYPMSNGSHPTPKPVPKPTSGAKPGK